MDHTQLLEEDRATLIEAIARRLRESRAARTKLGFEQRLDISGHDQLPTR
jgi:hypothetical protein